MAKIAKIWANEILDSRGEPTLKVNLLLDNGVFGSASVPSGTSKGHFEAMELRDGDTNRYHGMGVLKAVKNTNNLICQELKGQQAEQANVDQLLNSLDGTVDKRNLGGNTILGVSLALSRAIAKTYKMPLYQYISLLLGEKEKGKNNPFPIPLLVLISGGEHARNNLDFQEFLIAPVHNLFSERLRIAVEVFQSLTSVLIEKSYSLEHVEEGGYGPDLFDNEKAIQIILEAIEEAGYLPEININLGLDAAATSFWQPPKYIFKNEKKAYNKEDLISLYQKLCSRYPIKLLEDPFGEEDWEGWEDITLKMGKKITLVGDDVFVTNSERLEKGIKQGIANALIIKPNQIGTLTETLKTVKIAKKADYKIVVSHRAGETNDSFISDLAFGIGASYIKAGAPERGERIAKYNRLLEIQEEIGL